MDIPWPLVCVFLVATPATVWLVIKARVVPGSHIDMNSPPWSSAVAKAQASLPTLRQLFESRIALVAVKFPLRNTKDEIEHVWGELLSLTHEQFSASLSTPLLRGRPSSKPPFLLPLSALEDWMTQLPDGTVRGGFTTQLEISLARSEGRRVPAHIEDMEKRFVDV